MTCSTDTEKTEILTSLHFYLNKPLSDNSSKENRPNVTTGSFTEILPRSDPKDALENTDYQSKQANKIHI